MFALEFIVMRFGDDALTLTGWGLFWGIILFGALRS